MKLKVTSCRLSCLSSFSYFLFGSIGLAYANTLTSDGTIRIVLLVLTVSYALLAMVAYWQVVVPPKQSDARVFSLPVQKCIRVAGLAVPFPFAVLYGGVLIFSGIACGAGLAGELFESVGQYQIAKACYQQRLQFHQAIDSKQVTCDLATLGSICDKQHTYEEADQCYQEAERLLPYAYQAASPTALWPPSATSNPESSFVVISAGDLTEQPWAWREDRRSGDRISFGSGRTCIALPRLLRLLGQVSEQKAESEFSFGRWALEHKDESSLSLGKIFGHLDLRPEITDERSALPVEPPASDDSFSFGPHSDNTESDEARGAIGPQGSEATSVMGINESGYVFDSEELQGMFGKIPRDVALANFTFASKFYPHTRTKRQLLSCEPLPGTFLKPTMVSQLIPRQVKIVDRETFLKLYWLGKSSDANRRPREISVVFAADKSYTVPAQWPDWIKKRAAESGFAATVSCKENPPAPLQGELQFTVRPDNIQCDTINHGLSIAASNFDDLKSVFDEELRRHVWSYYSKPRTTNKPARIQLSVDSRSAPINLSDNEIKKLIAKGRSVGVQITYRDNRARSGLFDAEEFSHWGDITVLSMVLEDGQLTISASASNSIAPMPPRGLAYGQPADTRQEILEKIEKAIVRAANDEPPVDWFGDSFSTSG